ncbi:regulatory signaling modulator protein AmpE [Kangiella sp. TOML190]|uniref:regulatory signaling modulator protein AmpE n=1 Tax=Kangiella sp. TOML190 TaxID=2931351 RepID=UPI00203D63C2|nr:regulatory signaling modulator protein AmpE [Kangiella sp. TOML190]
MALLALLIALVIEHYYHKDTGDARAKVSHRNWFSRYQAKMLEWFGDQSWNKGWVSQALLLVAPAFIIYWIFAWYEHDGWFHGGFLTSALMLVLAVAILVVCLGPESPRKSLRAYYKARADHQDQTAFEAAREFTGAATADSIEELDLQVSRTIFKKAQTRYFAVVLWFMLLGPAGALLYRLTNWYLDNQVASGEDTDSGEPAATEPSNEQGFAYKLNLILEWIPARISALAYLLAGDMSAGVKKIKSDFFDFDKDGLSFVQEAGEASLGFYEADDKRGPSRWALKLMERAAVIIFALVALMSLLGLGFY